jgi:predicted GH43/DUF377 family glycosyl hydrolase
MRKAFLGLFVALSLLLALGCDTQERLLVSPDGVWRKQGTIMVGGADEQYSVQEPTVMYESGAFEMWFTCGWTTEGMCYATSPDGVNWTRLNSGLPLINNVAHGFVTKVGSTYYYYAAILPASTGFGRWHSTDKITWSQDGSRILSSTRSGWEAKGIGNIYVWVAGGTWYALYEALGADSVWRTGVATSSDGLTWTESSGNPKIELGSTGTCGGPEVHSVSGVYYVWVHCSENSDLPTDIYRYQSSDLNTFTRSPSWSVMARTTPDEGDESFVGQVADPSMVEVNGNTYMFYDATDTQKPTSGDGIHLKLAIATMTIAQLVTTDEGTKDTSSLTATHIDRPDRFFGSVWNLKNTATSPRVQATSRSTPRERKSLSRLMTHFGILF